MRKILLSLSFIFCICFCDAQEGLVYQIPEMKKAVIKENITYRTVNDTALKFDIYYPPAFNFKKNLPLVIFNNGVGSMDLPRWEIYRDWGKLIAANGMIAVNHQSRGGRTLEDGEALLDYLVKNAGQLSIDADKIGLWTCSGNARTGMRIAYKTRSAAIKVLVVYYGGPDSLGQLRQDLPALMVRAGLDAQFLNTGIDNFLQSCLQQDARIELINYLNGMHAFDIFTKTEESREIVVRTVAFLKKNLLNPVTNHDFVLTNKNFMWLVMSNQFQTALTEFRKARTKYRADTTFQPFFNAVIREDVLNANGYWLMDHQRQTEGLEIFKLAVESYPESPNAYESLSEAYERTGNNAEAVRNAELCLQKLPSATNINEGFRQRIKQGAEDIIRRLKGTASIDQLTVPPKRAHHDLIYDEANDNIIMIGGSTPVDGGNSAIFLNDVWKYDGKTWKQSGTVDNKRSGMKMAYDTKRNKLYSFGGFTGSSEAELRVWENNEWKTISNNREMAAAEPGFVYDSGRDKFIQFGGSGKRLANGTTWEWNGIEWKKVEGKGPAARQAFVMVYDSKRKKTVLYGGMDGAGKMLNDTWEFDGVKWDSIAVGINPGARISPGYAYDSKRGLLIIFGGFTPDTKKADTWSWDGKTWKQLTDTGPSARAMGYLAYDKKRDRVILFGGRISWPQDANDTWEWDGNKWVEIK